ncbi:uncharacterized protein METZ01_LOCUS493810, partial [marine metagenome]
KADGSGTANPTLTNCIISGNSTVGRHSLGSGMYIFNGNPTLTNCTITGNSKDARGGGDGMFLYNSYPTITNCIVWGNGANLQVDGFKLQQHSSPVITYSNIQGGWDGVGNIDKDPFFVSGVHRDDIPTSAGNFRLFNSSPAIDTGDPGTVAEGALVTDIEGEDRIQDGRIDMGAYEGGKVIPHYFVNHEADPSGDGSDWGQAFQHLNDALPLSFISKIWVAAGTYYPDEGLNASND